MVILLLIAEAVYPGVADASAADSPLEIEAGFINETLTNNKADWSTLYLDISKKLSKRRAVYGSLRQTERFKLKDDEGMAGYYHPLNKDWSGHVEGSISATHRVLPRWSLLGELIRSIKGGWLVNLGYRRTEYSNDRINLAVLAVERYWRSYHMIYSFYHSSLESDGNAQSHAGRINYYYTDRSRFGVAAAVGTEIENLGPGQGVLRSDVVHLAVTGRHWFSQKLGVTYDLSYHEQGESYLKRGVQIGIRYLF